MFYFLLIDELKRGALWYIIMLCLSSVLRSSLSSCFHLVAASRRPTHSVLHVRARALHKKPSAAALRLLDGIQTPYGPKMPRGLLCSLTPSEPFPFFSMP